MNKFSRGAAGLIAAFAICLAVLPTIAATAQNTLIYFTQGGSALTVASGGTVTIQSGGTLAVAATSGLTVGGLSNTGVVKCGTVTLDGSNPTPITTGLSSISGVTLTQQGSTAPGDDPVYLTVTTSSGTANVYAWKNTGGTDPTLVASTDNATVVQWIACGS